MNTTALDAEAVKACFAVGDWLEHASYLGNDPYQLDEFISSGSRLKLVGPILDLMRRTLKPYHAMIPRRLFTAAKPILIAQALSDSLSAEATMPIRSSTRRRVERLFQMLQDVRSPLAENSGWGLPFRWGGAIAHPVNWPTSVSTAMVLHGMLDAIELLDQNQSHASITSGIDFIVHECGYEETSSGICVRYGRGDRRLILNASAVAAAAFVRAGMILRRDDWIDLARRAVCFIISAQNQDGSWYYAQPHLEHPLDPIIDSRHTGYIIESLAAINQVLPDSRVNTAISKGWGYVKSSLIDGNRPRWSPESTWPVDGHDVAQAILTSLAVGDAAMAEAHVSLALRSFYLGEGRFAYKLFENNQRNLTVFIRWSQAPMYKALSKYISSKKSIEVQAFN